jgi:hypothetical protein
VEEDHERPCTGAEVAEDRVERGHCAKFACAESDCCADSH